MISQERLQNYVDWQLERGQRWLMNAPSPVKTQKKKLVLFLQDSVDTSAQAEQLFAKMLTAMTFAPGEYSLKLTSDFSEPMLKALQPELIVLLGKKTHQQFFGEVQLGTWLNSSAFLNIPTLCTFHPRELLESAELKRPAWTHCQTVMKSRVAG